MACGLYVHCFCKHACRHSRCLNPKKKAAHPTDLQLYLAPLFVGDAFCRLVELAQHVSARAHARVDLLQEGRDVRVERTHQPVRDAAQLLTATRANVNFFGSLLSNKFCTRTVSFSSFLFYAVFQSGTNPNIRLRNAKHENVSRPDFQLRPSLIPQCPKRKGTTLTKIFSFVSTQTNNSICENATESKPCPGRT